MTRHPASGGARAVRRGQWAERLAAAYLRLCGMSLLDHNLRGGGGEIDLLARDGDDLVFVEVRLRHQRAWIPATSSLSLAKRRRLLGCARELMRRPQLCWPGRGFRFDLVALELADDGLRLRHLRGVLL